jgi:hypothetical protein
MIHWSEYYVKQREELDPLEVKKLEQAADVHGYRGPSRKKHNGIVPIRPTDHELWKVYKKLLDSPDVQTLTTGKTLVPVKVVAHVPSGNRLVGAMMNGELIILGMGNYSGK